MIGEKPSKGYYAEVLKSSVGKTLSRMAVIAPRGIESFVLQELRSEVLMYEVRTIAELRAAFKSQDSMSIPSFDIRELKLGDTAILADCLSTSLAPDRVIYLMTSAQFDLFENVFFDVVV